MKTENRILERGIDPSKPSKRVWEVDLLRGIPVLLMILYHFCFDVTQVKEVCINTYTMYATYPFLKDFVFFVNGVVFTSMMENVLIPVFGSIFVFVCGLSTALSHNNLRRSLLLSLVAGLISLFTYLGYLVFHVDMFIGFGVIHLMASQILFYSLLELLFKKVFKRKVPAVLCLMIGILLLFSGLLLRTGYKNANGNLITWPTKVVGGGPVHEFYSAPFAFFFSAIGKYGNTVDWWPILPFGGVLFIGIAIGKALYEDRKESLFPEAKIRKVLTPISFLGRHTLEVYIIHQPIIILVMGIVLLSLGFRFW